MSTERSSPASSSWRRPPSWGRAAVLIARHDLIQVLRQRETLLWVFVMPLVFFYFIGTVTGGMGGQSDARPDALSLTVPSDGGFLVDELVRRLEQQNYAVTQTMTDDEEEEPPLELVIPAQEDGTGFTTAVLGGESTPLTLRRRGGGLSADYHRVRVARAVYAVVADLAVHAQRGEVATPASMAELAAMPRALTLDVSSAGEREKIPTGFEQTIPGTMVMFTMLVLLTSGAIGLVIEREQGLLRRLSAAPIPRSAIVAGKWVARMAVGLVQIGFAMLAGTALFGMSWGRALPMVAVILFLWAALNASLGILLANVARSPGQMSGLGVMTTMSMAALGGCWWPIEITPEWMQNLAMFLPTGWAMDALHRLVTFGDRPSAVVAHAALLGGTALLCGRLAAKKFRYE